MALIIVILLQLGGLAYTLHNIGWEFRVNVFAMCLMWLGAFTIDFSDYLITLHFFK